MKEQGFTLIEVLVFFITVSVIGWMAVLAFDPVSQFQQRLDAKRKNDLATLQIILARYYNDNGRYPSLAAKGDYRMRGFDGNPVDWGIIWQPYMQYIPKDPNPKKTYVYIPNASGQAYRLYASLDRGKNDKKACNKGNACLTVPSGVSCGEKMAICNYGVSSANISP